MSKPGGRASLHRFANSSSAALPVVPFQHCAAKTTKRDSPGTAVLDHCRHVGCVAETLVQTLPQAVRTLLTLNPALAAALHDVGKVSPGFQLKYFGETVVRQYAPGLRELCFEEKHAAIGAAAIDRWTGTKGSPVARAASVHHGSGQRTYPPDSANILGGVSWAEERHKLIVALTQTFGVPPPDWQAQADPRLLAGLTCVSDWIGSDETFYPSDSVRLVESDPSTTAHRALDACGLLPVAFMPGLSFRDIFGFAPRPEQEAFLDAVTGPGLYVLEAPMGTGKTEAALYAAYRLIVEGHHRGIYFALPTRLTSDRIHERVRNFLARVTRGDGITPLIAHGMAWLRSYEHGGADSAPGRSWFHPLKRALLHPFAVGTIDQALLGVLNVRHNFVRLFGLSGKAVILDEVHSYDLYTGTLLDVLVQALLGLGCTVLVLSATLTATRRRRLVPAVGSATSEAYPLASGLRGGSAPFAQPLPPPPNTVYQVRMESWSNSDLSQHAVAAARRGQCVVCIANTVAKAQTWYRTVCAERNQGEFPVGILHARFPLYRREELEDHWLPALSKDDTNRPPGCVLIATQLLEQSVDIDADLMFSELAPTDMLLQRMGRLWRHARAWRPCPAPQFVILTAELSDATTQDAVVDTIGKENCCVYAPYVLMRTHAVWRALSEILLPGDIRRLVEATYADLPEEPDLMRSLREDLACKSQRLRRLAIASQDAVGGLPVGTDSEEAATRYSDLPTASALLVSAIETGGRIDRARLRLLDGTTLDLSAYEGNFNATRALHRNLVTLARYRLPSQGEVRWLKCHFYTQPIILRWNADDGILSGLDGTATSLSYSPEFGVFRNVLQGSHSAPVGDDDVFDPFDNERFDW